MKAQELMIGDWIAHKDYPSIPVQVEGIDSNKICLKHSLLWQEEKKIYERIERHSEVIDCNEMIPIPLTPEILEKNGFKDIDKGENCDGFDIYWRNDDGYSINMQDLHLHYVHELQHALRLCEIEKEIQL